MAELIEKLGNYALAATVVAGLTLWYSDCVKQAVMQRFNEKPAIVQQYKPKHPGQKHIGDMVKETEKEGLAAKIMEGFSDAKGYVSSIIGKNIQE